MRAKTMMLAACLVGCSGATYVTEDVVYLGGDGGERVGALAPDASLPGEDGGWTGVDASVLSAPPGSLDAGVHDAGAPLDGWTVIGPTLDANGPWGECLDVFDFCVPYTPTGFEHPQCLTDAGQTSWSCAQCGTTDAGIAIFPPPPCGAGTYQGGGDVWCCEADGGPVSPGGQ